MEKDSWKITISQDYFCTELPLFLDRNDLIIRKLVNYAMLEVELYYGTKKHDPPVRKTESYQK